MVDRVVLEVQGVQEGRVAKGEAIIHLGAPGTARQAHKARLDNLSHQATPVKVVSLEDTDFLPSNAA